jgi:hypothetical protein
MELDREKQKQAFNRVSRLYKDWLSTRKTGQIREMKKMLKEAKKDKLPSSFKAIIREMGQDGETLLKHFHSKWTLFGESPSKAKSKLIEILIKSTPTKVLSEAKKESQDGSVVSEIGLSYYPISDRSNAMHSVIDPTDRDLIIQIRNAVTGGNTAIAAELIKNGWSALSLKERNGLIEWVNNLGNFNVEVEGYEDHVPSKSKGVVMKVMSKKSDMTKDEFVGQFLRTAEENTRLV